MASQGNISRDHGTPDFDLPWPVLQPRGASRQSSGEVWESRLRIVPAVEQLWFATPGNSFSDFTFWQIVQYLAAERPCPKQFALRGLTTTVLTCLERVQSAHRYGFRFPGAWC